MFIFIIKYLKCSLPVNFSGICRYFKNSTGNLPILNQPVCSIPLGSWVPKIGDPNSRPLAMLRPNASLSSALNMLVQGMFCGHFVTTENFNVEMHKSIRCSCLHFPWHLLFYQPKFNISSTGNSISLETTGSLTNPLNLYSLLHAAGVSSIPIVDENDSLLDTYSRRYTILYLQMTIVFGCVLFFPCIYLSIPRCSDITALAKDKVYTHVRLDEMTIHQVC